MKTQALTEAPQFGTGITSVIDGFNINVTVEIDEMPDNSYLGHYSNNWETGAIDRKRMGNYGRNEYRYFIPSPGCEVFPHNKSRGYKAEWMRAALQDYKYFEKLNNGIEWFEVIIVTASKNGIELGSASLWGIESSADDSYRIQICNELIAEAIAEAKEAIQSPCQSA